MSISAIHARRGATIDPRTGAVVTITGGFAVSLPGFEDQLPSAVLTAATNSVLVARHRRALAVHNRYVGVWLRGSTAYLDVSEVVNDGAVACALGRRWNQLAIYDFTARRSIDCRASQRRSNRAAARDLAPERPVQSLDVKDGGVATGYLEVWATGGRQLLPLDADRATIGRAESNDILVAEATVSRLHAVVERYPTGWSIRDLGSANGTFVNGTRVLGERRLKPGDEIGVGSARLFFRSPDSETAGATVGADEPPELTRKEREVLLALCRPLADGRPFPHPATTKELAETFVVSEAAIKWHLVNLYDKFGIHTSGESRRIELANEAIRRRAVTLAELREPTS